MEGWVEIEDLIRRAMSKATGATNHEVSNVVSAIRSAARVLEQEPDDAAMEIIIVQSCRILRAFLYHGDVHRARRDVMSAWRKDR